MNEFTEKELAEFEKQFPTSEWVYKHKKEMRKWLKEHDKRLIKMIINEIKQWLKYGDRVSPEDFFQELLKD